MPSIIRKGHRFSLGDFYPNTNQLKDPRMQIAPLGAALADRKQGNLNLWTSRVIQLGSSQMNPWGFLHAIDYLESQGQNPVIFEHKAITRKTNKAVIMQYQGREMALKHFGLDVAPLPVRTFLLKVGGEHVMASIVGSSRIPPVVYDNIATELNLSGKQAKRRSISSDDPVPFLLERNGVVSPLPAPRALGKVQRLFYYRGNLDPEKNVVELAVTDKESLLIKLSDFEAIMDDYGRKMLDPQTRDNAHFFVKVSDPVIS